MSPNNEYWLVYCILLYIVLYHSTDPFVYEHVELQPIGWLKYKSHDTFKFKLIFILSRIHIKKKFKKFVSCWNINNYIKTDRFETKRANNP